MTEEELLKLSNYSNKNNRGKRTIELYGCDIPLRKYGYYPTWLPIYLHSFHGPSPRDLPLKTELGSWMPYMLLYSKRMLLSWKKLTTKPAFIMKSPFVQYRRMENINVSESANGTLAFFSHNVAGLERYVNIDNYIQELKKLPENYQPVSICLHFEDVRRGDHKPFLKNGIDCYTAGDWLDPKFIERFYDILKNFKYSTSNIFGSYTYYSVELGIPFFIYGEVPTYINISDHNIPIGDYKKEISLENYNKVVSIFSGMHTEITEEQRLLTLAELGIDDGVGRLQMARILYGAYLIHKYNQVKSKFRIKSLAQFSLKESLTLMAGAVLSRILYLLPSFDNYLKQKQFFDLIFLSGGAVIKQQDKNLIVVNDASTIGPYKVVVRRNTSDHIAYNQVLMEEEYKPLVDTVMSLQEPDSIQYIIDAGGNIGLTSLYLKKRFPKSKIIILEPDKENSNAIRDNMRLNDISDIIELNAALWHKNEDLVIDHSFRGGVEWSLAVKPKKYIEDESVKAVTLLDLLAEHRFPHIDILKMDIEGAERHVFEDPEINKMILSQVKYIAIEIHDEFKIRKYLVDQFESNGFKCKEYGETLVGYNTTLVDKHII